MVPIQKPPHLVWVFDDGFADCTMVALHSALRVTPGPMRVDLHPSGPVSISEADLDHFRRHYPKLELRMSPLDLSSFPELRRSPLPLSCCGRLLLPAVHSGRVIYLDGDILVRKDLHPLSQADLEGRAIGACLAPGDQALLALSRAGLWRRSAAAAERIARRSERLRGQDYSRYFNSGVLVLDLDQIVAKGLDVPMRDIAAAAEFDFPDQDWLNIVFRDETALLPPEWNSGWGNPRTAAAYVPRAIRQDFALSRSDPSLLHFTGAEKPWQAKTPPFKLHMLNKTLERRQRARFWAEYQAARRETEVLLGRSLFGPRPAAAKRPAVQKAA